MTFNGWTPANYEKTYQPQVTVVQALYESLNVPTAYVGNELGPATIVKTAHEMGINEDLQAYLPISIGADETTLLELTSAYQVFRDRGRSVAAVCGRGGPRCQGPSHLPARDQSNRIIRPAVAYLITGALKAVLRYGTGASAGRSDWIFRRRQDRHDPGLQGRVLHRLHAGDRLRCVGRLRRARELGADRRAGGAPAWFSSCRMRPGRPRGFPRAVGHHDGDDRSRVRRLATSACPSKSRCRSCSVPSRRRCVLFTAECREHARARPSDDDNSAAPGFTPPAQSRKRIQRPKTFSRSRKFFKGIFSH